MSTLSPFEHTAIGALAGVLEVSVMQPTVTVKNALQEGRALPKTPLAFYRGYLVRTTYCQLVCYIHAVLSIQSLSKASVLSM